MSHRVPEKVLESHRDSQLEHAGARESQKDPDRARERESKKKKFVINFTGLLSVSLWLPLAFSGS